jgi:hypothetical protein
MGTNPFYPTTMLLRTLSSLPYQPAIREYEPCPSLSTQQLDPGPPVHVPRASIPSGPGVDAGAFVCEWFACECVALARREVNSGHFSAGTQRGGMSAPTYRGPGFPSCSALWKVAVPTAVRFGSAKRRARRRRPGAATCARCEWVEAGGRRSRSGRGGKEGDEIGARNRCRGVGPPV